MVHSRRVTATNSIRRLGELAEGRRPGHSGVRPSCSREQQADIAFRRPQQRLPGREGDNHALEDDCSRRKRRLKRASVSDFMARFRLSKIAPLRRRNASLLSFSPDTRISATSAWRPCARARHWSPPMSGGDPGNRSRRRKRLACEPDELDELDMQRCSFCWINRSWRPDLGAPAGKIAGRRFDPIDSGPDGPWTSIETVLDQRHAPIGKTG